MAILYLIIGFVASTIGAISGLGGGVMIKPILDAFGHFDLSTIGVLSSCSVFAMSIASLAKKFIAKATFEYSKLLPLSLGSVIGGVLGKYFFQIFLAAFENQDTAQMIQSICLAALMIIILVMRVLKDKIRTYNVTNPLICVLAGTFMGTISAFLGIGGGPVNVIVITLLFSCNAKDAAIYSIFAIFFSQMSTLTSVVLLEGLEGYDLSMVGYMIVGGISGGFLGDYLSTKMDDVAVEKLFNIVMVVIIGINIFNIITVLI
ncbi:MAG: hypothetical protein ATN35_06675 [Epulopiscium sp. Nele67-Bin004]|nr:MAG: hypothetical protein ATN35_06675 [Epulopiscium sp. Nele67-Bin004]